MPIEEDIQKDEEAERKVLRTESLINKLRASVYLRWLRGNKFYQTTPVDGLNLISHSKFTWEQTVWYILIVTFACFTVKSVYDTTYEFFSKPTTTSVRILDTTVDKSQMYISPETMWISFPLASILKDRMLADFDFEAHNLTSKDVKYVVEEVRAVFYKTSYQYRPNLLPIADYLQQQLHQTIEKLKTKEDFLVKPWDPFIQYSIFHLEIEYMRDYEDEVHELLYAPYEPNWSCRTCTTKCQELWGRQEGNTYCSLLTFLGKSSITGDEYYDKFYTELSSFYSIHYRTATLHPEITGKVWKSYECQLKFGLNKNSSSCGMTVFLERDPSWEHSLLFNVKYDRHHRFDYFKFVWKKEDYVKDLSFLTGKQIEAKKAIHFGVIAPAGNRTVGKESIKEIFNSTTKCFKQETAEACKIACHQHQLHKDCGCMQQNMRYLKHIPLNPLCFFRTYMSSPVCTTNLTKHGNEQRNQIEAKAQAKQFKKLSECEIFCNTLPTCFRRFTDYAMVSSKKLAFSPITFGQTDCFDDFERTCDLVLELQMEIAGHSLYVYKQYEMEYKITTSDFFSNLGGSFDLWIGISVISLVHLVVYITKQIFYIIFRRKTLGKVRKATVTNMVLESWRSAAAMGSTNPSFAERNQKENIDDGDVETIVRNMARRIKELENQIKKLNDGSPKPNNGVVFGLYDDNVDE